jgi:hypothetical protein
MPTPKSAAFFQALRHGKGVHSLKMVDLSSRKCEQGLRQESSWEIQSTLSFFQSMKHRFS